MECLTPMQSAACLAETAEILVPLFGVSWLVGMMVATAIAGSARRQLMLLAAAMVPVGFFSMLAVAVVFAEAGAGGVWELLVGPAVVVGESAGLARVIALRETS